MCNDGLCRTLSVNTARGMTMEFRDLKRQYQAIKEEIDQGIAEVIGETGFIQGRQVRELEEQLAEYVGVRHCISCANGTDALQLALMAWGIGAGDAVFVPDFTFFSSGEVVSAVGAVPIFVDVEEQTYNIDCRHLEHMIEKVQKDGRWKPRVIIAVDLFGQPADLISLRRLAQKYDLLLLEDAAQGFGGSIGSRRACSLGDIATTSFFPAKPLGCYGDGGAIFTNEEEWEKLLRSCRVHGKGSNKYDNVRIGMNSRLDTLQAAVLLAKLPIFVQTELSAVQRAAERYTQLLEGVVDTPVAAEGFSSSWAQYTIRLRDRAERDGLQGFLKEQKIPSMVYYQKPMHRQLAFAPYEYSDEEYAVTNRLSDIVLSLPFHPYLKEEEIEQVTDAVRTYVTEHR